MQRAPLTVYEALQWATGKLKAAKVDAAQLDAEILLAHAMRVSKTWLFTHLSDQIGEDVDRVFIPLVERRAKREPIAYLIGSKPFYGRPFAVTPATLIPRPATETLVEQALARINPDERTLIVDIGTGSGAIAITLAAESSASVIATDVSREALAVAAQNAVTHNVSDRVTFLQGDLLAPVIDWLRDHTNQVFDHVILCANLPYLTDTQVCEAEPDVKDYEPYSALVSEEDGLGCYWSLFRTLRSARGLFPKHLTTLIEIDPSQTESAAAMIRHAFPGAKPMVVRDLSNLDRVVISEI